MVASASASPSAVAVKRANANTKTSASRLVALRKQLIANTPYESLLCQLHKPRCATLLEVSPSCRREAMSSSNRNKEPASMRASNAFAAVATKATRPMGLSCSHGVQMSTEQKTCSTPAAPTGTRSVVALATTAQQRSGCDWQMLECLKHPYAASIVNTKGSILPRPDIKRTAPIAADNRIPRNDKVTTLLASVSCPSITRMSRRRSALDSGDTDSPSAVLNTPAEPCGDGLLNFSESSKRNFCCSATYGRHKRCNDKSKSSTLSGNASSVVTTATRCCRRIPSNMSECPNAIE
mmetsp:Transcript_25177/g.57318  ORF Transcript_25177/g.57318 Transcript_25177/m.57318 type:complete len:294 (+) Transcript_25177:1013-1894(+)